MQETFELATPDPLTSQSKGPFRGRLASRIKWFLPRGLFGRSVLLLAAPLIISQVVGTWVFYDRLWSTVMRRLSASVANDVVLIVEARHAAQEKPDHTALLELIGRTSGMSTTLLKVSPPPGPEMPVGGIERYLGAALKERQVGSFEIDASSLPREILVRLETIDGVLQVSVPRDRLYTSMTYVFLMWMIGTALVTFSIAMLFLRNQVRSLRRLAIAAEAFGRGLDVPHFRIEGATEVRQAAAAFLTMRQRIQRQIAKRTTMLAGISHDLRTPLTRMKLELELLGDSERMRGLESDVIEMERMIEGYLSFARGEGGETAQPTDLVGLLRDVVATARRQGIAITLACPDTLDLPVRRDALRRCFVNLIGNAARYGHHVWVTVVIGRGRIDIMIDDDGPGIPEAKRGSVFQPFFRLEDSRNPSTGGVGLGLTIARDIMHSHGGDLTLGTSPQGGLRVRAFLPASDITSVFDER
jgi:two-component system osmolarity sensor histidine kinase EnvZ